MCRRGTWAHGLVVGLAVLGLDDLRGLFKLKPFCYSVFLQQCTFSEMPTEEELSTRHDFLSSITLSKQIYMKIFFKKNYGENQLIVPNH